MPAPTSPICEAMLTMLYGPRGRGAPRSIICRAAAWHAKKTPLRFVSTIRSQVASSTSRASCWTFVPGAVDEHVDRAERLGDLLDARGDRVRLAHVERHGAARPAPATASSSAAKAPARLGARAAAVGAPPRRAPRAASAAATAAPMPWRPPVTRRDLAGQRRGRASDAVGASSRTVDSDGLSHRAAARRGRRRGRARRAGGACSAPSGVAPVAPARTAPIPWWWPIVPPWRSTTSSAAAQAAASGACASPASSTVKVQDQRRGRRRRCRRARSAGTAGRASGPRLASSSRAQAAAVRHGRETSMVSKMRVGVARCARPSGPRPAKRRANQGSAAALGSGRAAGAAIAAAATAAARVRDRRRRPAVVHHQQAALAPRSSGSGDDGGALGGVVQPQEPER